MSAYRLTVTDVALSDISEIATYLAQASQSVAIGVSFYDRVEATMAAVLEQPLAFPHSRHAEPGDDTLRQTTIEDFHSYVMFFRIVGPYVRILRVVHGSRDLPKQLDDPSG